MRVKMPVSWVVLVNGQRQAGVRMQPVVVPAVPVPQTGSKTGRNAWQDRTVNRATGMVRTARMVCLLLK